MMVFFYVICLFVENLNEMKLIGKVRRRKGKNRFPDLTKTFSLCLSLTYCIAQRKERIAVG